MVAKRESMSALLCNIASIMSESYLIMFFDLDILFGTLN
jgi:hypothetical protein